MTHYIIEGGRYERAFLAMPEEYKLPFVSLEGNLMRGLLTGAGGSTGKSGEPEPGKVATGKTGREKTKYSCPGCGANVWGKPGLNLKCEDCDQAFEAIG